MKIKNADLLYYVGGVMVASVIAGAILLAPRLFAATPASGTISPASPTVSWTGAFVASNPVSCFSVAGIDPTCDRFKLTIVPPTQDFVVTVRVTAANATDETAPTDDIDLFVRDPNNNTIAVAGTAGGVEEIVLRNPPAGTYTVIVQPFLVFPMPTAPYTGVATMGSPAHDERSNSYHGALFTSDFVGVPDSTPASSSPLVAGLKVSFNYVGRQAAEPTVAVNANNTAFYAAATFDFPTPTSPERLARTVVMRSRDKAATWQPVAGFALSAESLTEPPFTLDPMIYLDPEAGNIHPVTGRQLGRVFSVDLNLACGANAVFSDDDGDTWTSRPLFGCDQPVNDHHTIVTARPSPPGAPGLTTIGYPNLLYFWFNRVSDSSGNRSNNGGLTFVPAGTAFTGTDPNAGSFCGGLHGHLAADSAGRIFLPKGHCGLPWVARSEDGGTTWTRVRIAGHTPMDDHEVSLAVDTADNIYAVWQDRVFRYPFLSISRDHGQTWSTPVAFAPPGVHEVNFPTIVAGDPGRIAVLFPGSQSQNFSDATRPWNIYIVVSVNALDANPIFTWTTANDPKDPVHRGACGPGRCDAEDGGSMFDFLDIQVSPADGAFWGTASDTCVGECVTNPSAQKLRPGQGVAIRQVKGPSLFVNR
ncbi:MAG: hypothetical protein ACRD35_06740 [Candidatus Acidiferrales bacterium]